MTLQRNSSSKPESLWRTRAKLERARNKTAIRRLRSRCRWEWEFRGQMGPPFDAAIRTHDEILLCGAAGTGKTLRVLYFLNEVCWDYPAARILIVRKVRADLAQTTLVTYERDIMGFDHPIVSSVQRDHRMSYKYPNGSEIVVGGLDRPGRILSGEYDIIYVAEAVQFELNDWEFLGMRLRAGPYPWPLLIADTNPDVPDHWLKQRADNGVVLLLNTYHEDNPAYHDGENFTEAGVRYVLGKLQRLTGVRRKRYLDNKWSVAEGAIYDEWNEDVHLIRLEDCPEFVRRWRSIDFGYKHPFVCHWWGEDHDNRLYLYREIYHTHLLVADAAIDMVRLEAGLSAHDLSELKQRYPDMSDPDGRFWGELWRLAHNREPISGTVADHDAEDRATLEKYGIRSKPARKAVMVGIQAVQERIRIQPDGRPRIFIVRGARVQMDMELREAGKPTSTQEEIGAYVWNDATKKEEPVKEDDHGVDCARYLVMHFDDPELHKTIIQRRPVRNFYANRAAVTRKRPR